MRCYEKNTEEFLCKHFLSQGTGLSYLTLSPTELSFVIYDLFLLDINECDRVNCSGNGACKDLVNGFFCDCNAGFVGDFCEAGMFCHSVATFSVVTVFSCALTKNSMLLSGVWISPRLVH